VLQVGVKKGLKVEGREAARQVDRERGRLRRTLLDDFEGFDEFHGGSPDHPAGRSIVQAKSGSVSAIEMRGNSRIRGGDGMNPSRVVTARSKCRLTQSRTAALYAPSG
jgi:hypothetical protein